MDALAFRPAAGGYPAWVATDPGCGVAFVGRGAARPRREVLAATTGIDRPVGWLRQVHGSTSLEAGPGCVGEADALTTSRRNLALAISTADCVPVILVGADRVAAVHAGWRGLVAGVLPRALQAFEASSATPAAWIGPAIGACCYEVGDEVAEGVLAACGDPDVSRSGPGKSRPHLDLARAAEAQLRSSGVDRVTSIRVCTRCDPRLHSFRREGPAAGRNLAFGWLPAR